MKHNRFVFDIFISCTPGLETCLLKELDILGIAVNNKNVIPGGVGFKGDVSALVECNTFIRTASHVLVRIGEFYATGFPELKRKLNRLSWDDYLGKVNSVKISVSCHKSRLNHKRAIAERIQEFLQETMKVSIHGSSQDSSEKTQQIMVRVYRDQFTISLDASGELYRRGYRQALAKAPLRETLAAGLIIHSGWDRKSPLIDPFCGSGVIPIEAAMMANGTPPNRERHFPCLDWPLLSDRKINVDFDRQIAKSAICDIAGSDRDHGAIRMASENASRAKVSNLIKFDQKSISEVLPGSKTGWIVTNPPYGKRIHSSQDLRNLYARFGQILRDRFQKWHLTMICNDQNMVNQIKVPLEKGPMLDNGGIKVWIFSGIVK